MVLLARTLLDMAGTLDNGPKQAALASMAGLFQVDLEALHEQLLTPRVDHAPFTEAEWGRIRKAPFYVLLMVGLVDGELDEKESATFGEMLEQPGTVADPWLRKIVLDVREEAAVLIMGTVNRRGQDIGSQLAEISRLFDQRTSPEVARSFKLALHKLGTDIAESSGGFLGLFGNKISPAEKKALTTLSTILGIE
ncbi:hypothetical protein [Hyalangium versicolor]|uniref:hypothetical protein n=1 Tax=Hyalangium versicolor TaxID=2861190 RepID=UPI001CCD8032|nr:hypothetical protein [Hyalangium versicolor]